MAKIKFNLLFGGEQIRTLDDLRKNFFIDDVLDAYNNGILAKWLDVHYRFEQLEQVNAIQAIDARSILTELIRIFDVTSDPSEIQEGLSVLEYLEERKKFWNDIKAGKFDEIARNITSSKPAKKSYYDLIQEIIDNHEDLNHIYDCLDVITADYSDILKERYSELFAMLHTYRPLTLYSLFAHHGTRPYFVLNDDEIKAEYYAEDVQFRYPPRSGYSYQLTVKDDEYDECNKWGVFTSDDSLAEETEILPSVLEKLRFINTLCSVSWDNFVSEKSILLFRDLLDRKHPYLKFFEGIEEHEYSRDDEIWHVVKKPDKKFMVFCPSTLAWGGSFGLISSTYSHRNFYRLNHYLEFTLPIFEGIDVKTEKSGGIYWCCEPFYYIEAR